MSKVIWYLHHYAGSPTLGMSYRPYYLSREFQKNGHKPFIISASYHHLLQTKRKQSERIVHEMQDELNYIWIKTNAYKKNNIKRIINMFSYSVRLLTCHKKIISISGKPDIIIISSSHLFHYPAALLLAKKFNCKIIFEVRDLWPLSVIELVGVSPLNPLIMLMSVIEKMAYSRSDYVVSLLSNSQHYMQKKGLDVKKFRYIPNGTDENIQCLSEPGELPAFMSREIKQKKQSGCFLLGYAGAHGIPNALDQMLDALAILQNKENILIHVFFIGDGNQKTRLVERAKMLNLSNITFFNRINKHQVHMFLSEMDALFIGWQNKPIYQYGISPNKLFDYMLSSKPIIHASNAIEDPVTKAQCGIITLPENPEQLVKAMIQMAAMPPEDRHLLGQNGQRYVLQNHNYISLAKQYGELFT